MAEAASRPAISDWGTPDPCNVDAYPAPGGTTWRQWGWQFLRRRQDYRRRWEEVVWPYINDDGAWNLEREDDDHANAKLCALQEGRSFHWRHPFAILRHEFRVVSSTIPGLNSALDPRLDQPPVFEGSFTTEVMRGPVEPPAFLLEFDPRLPSEPQLKAARELLDFRAKNLPSTRQLQDDKFRRYLRFLDFNVQGTSREDIGRELFPRAADEELRDLIRNTRRAAVDCQDKYLRIALNS